MPELFLVCNETRVTHHVPPRPYAAVEQHGLHDVGGAADIKNLTQTRLAERLEIVVGRDVGEHCPLGFARHGMFLGAIQPAPIGRLPRSFACSAISFSIEIRKSFSAALSSACTVSRSVMYMSRVQ